ncbi:MAG: hypothetical protein KDN18_24100 [Verrucomicrobiae bacterium]|nr:hypothetical protein [Verrucomicrobiae bacterium]
MPAAITLGTGPAPGDPSKASLLEVHLLPDYPATPVCLGERWGTQSTGGGFTLQDATAYRFEEHLRACGCDWLRQVANEERLSGRIFTPDEILQRRPATATPPPLTKPVPPPLPPSGTLEKIRKALADLDYEEIEGLRDVLTDELVRTVSADWSADLSWEVKDAYAALLLDQTADCVRPIFRDALASPTIESRAYAICVLTKDFSHFTGMLVNGSLDESRVAQALRLVEPA